MNDRIAWLRAVLDEVERRARSAQPGEWIPGQLSELVHGPSGPLPWGHVEMSNGETFPQVVVVEANHICANGSRGGMIAFPLARTRYRLGNADHIITHQPRAALADVEGKRHIIAIYEREQEYAAANSENEGRLYLMADVIAGVCSAYATWPGYRPEWGRTT